LPELQKTRDTAEHLSPEDLRIDGGPLNPLIVFEIFFARVVGFERGRGERKRMPTNDCVVRRGRSVVSLFFEFVASLLQAKEKGE